VGEYLLTLKTYLITSCQIRLVDWDEGKYRNTDKPNPRGEIYIGGKVVVDGYFAEASKENVNFKEIDGVRYFCTGDIGEVLPDGTFKIIGKHLSFSFSINLKFRFCLFRS
jgi:long-subunit acyl-CoA synthetase (AMP-forming)